MSITATAANDVEIRVAANRKRGMVRLSLDYALVRIGAEMLPTQAREVGQALIDAADRAEGREAPTKREPEWLAEALNSCGGVYRP